MKYQKPNWLVYRLTQIISWFISALIFGRKILRNELRGKKGAYVVVANHEAALDFVNLIGLTHRRMSFVISYCFFHTLPVRGLLRHLGVIPKQQFQTSPDDLRKMKAVIDAGEPLVIYPAGLMCEDGLSTPIPRATYKFLKWLKTDVYAARSSGSYFVMPKWTKGIRPGKTYIDVYKIIGKEELETMDVEEIRRRTERALLFDAYREQEASGRRSKHNRNIEGLQNVLYVCPNCRSEYTIRVQNGDTIFCTACGFAERSDELAILHKCGGPGKELRYASDWSRSQYDIMEQRIRNGELREMAADTKILMIDHRRKKFTEAGEGRLRLSAEGFRLLGTIRGEAADITVPIRSIPILPFGPGHYLELQQGSTVYRCMLADGRQAMKFIQMVKIFYELNNGGLLSRGTVAR